MDSPVTKPLSPSKAPLNTASPERINQQKIICSQSMPMDILQTKQSSVQAKIAFLNNLTRTGSPQSPTAPQNASSTTAAVQRAILGREEAESALTRANSMLAEAEIRERRISERLESLLEELQNTRERQAHERGLFEKEIRKARKEAFRASSTLVKFQEELKLSKGEIRNLRDEVRTERDAKEKAKQEAFERAYALAGLTEELHTVQEKLRAFEANLQSDALETQARDMRSDQTSRPKQDEDHHEHQDLHRRPKRRMDEIDQVKEIASPSSDSYIETTTPPKKMRLSRRASNKENIDPKVRKEGNPSLDDLISEVVVERRLRQKAEDMVHFLKMECQFKRCSCRVAERQGTQYVHDAEWEKFSENIVFPSSKAGDPQPVKEPLLLELDTEIKQEPVEQAGYSTVEQTLPIQPDSAQEVLISFSPSTGTFQTVPRTGQNCIRSIIQDEPPLKLSDIMDPESPGLDLNSSFPQQELTEEPDLVDMSTQSPYQERLVDEDVVEASNVYAPPELFPLSNERNIQTTLERETENNDATLNSEKMNVKTVPLLSEDGSSRNLAAMIPGTPISREAALAQIRARRDRTRSAMKRSASASEATTRSAAIGVTPLKGLKRGPGRATDTRSESDVVDRMDGNGAFRR